MVIPSTFKCHLFFWLQEGISVHEFPGWQWPVTVLELGDSQQKKQSPNLKIWTFTSFHSSVKSHSVGIFKALPSRPPCVGHPMVLNTTFTAASSSGIVNEFWSTSGGTPIWIAGQSLGSMVTPKKVTEPLLSSQNFSDSFSRSEFNSIIFCTLGSIPSDEPLSAITFAFSSAIELKVAWNLRFWMGSYELEPPSKCHPATKPIIPTYPNPVLPTRPPCSTIPPSLRSTVGPPHLFYALSQAKANFHGAQI